MKPIRSQIEAFLETSGMTPTALSRAVSTDPNLVRQILKKGRDPRETTITAIRDFIEQHEAGAV